MWSTIHAAYIWQRALCKRKSVPLFTLSMQWFWSCDMSNRSYNKHVYSNWIVMSATHNDIKNDTRTRQANNINFLVNFKCNYLPLWYGSNICWPLCFAYPKHMLNMNRFWFCTLIIARRLWVLILKTFQFSSAAQHFNEFIQTEWLISNEITAEYRPNIQLNILMADCHAFSIWILAEFTTA